ncbi:MAG: hypothetical protein KDD51_09670 [Bdellovibrionales bacterium]|nr:hypothetical protein [Bdellovibrionales bacterium]
MNALARLRRTFLKAALLLFFVAMSVAAAEEAALEPSLSDNVNQLDKNAQSAEQASEDCNPDQEDCGQREQVAEDLRDQKDLNQKSLDSINERLKNSGYRIEGIDKNGDLRITDSHGSVVKKLGEAELGYSRATQNGNLIERYGKTDRGLSVETVRDANGNIADLRINEFSGDFSGANAGIERSVVSIDSAQLADLTIDPSTSGPVVEPRSNLAAPTPTSVEPGPGSIVTPEPPIASSSAGTGAAEPTLLESAVSNASESLSAAQRLYEDTLSAANDFISELRNPVEQPAPTVEKNTQAATGYSAMGNTGERIYRVADALTPNQDRIAVVVDTNDKNVSFRMKLAQNGSVYDDYIKTSDLNSPAVKDFIAKYPNHRVDIMTHGFSAYDGGIQSGANSFMYAGSESMNNFFSGMRNEVCLYACSVGASLYTSSGELNTKSFQYQVSSLTHAPITAADRTTFAGGYQAAGTTRYTLTVPASVSPYPNLYTTMSQHSGTLQTWANLYNTLSLIP